MNDTERLIEASVRKTRGVVCRMMIDWLRSSPRKPPELAFSAGPERDLADEIEMAIQREKGE